VKSLRLRLGREVNPPFPVQEYRKAVIVCKRLKHPNILSIEGVAPELFECSMVSQWMPNGNLQGYVTEHPGVNRLDLVRPTHWEQDLQLTRL